MAKSLGVSLGNSQCIGLLKTSKIPVIWGECRMTWGGERNKAYKFGGPRFLG